MNTVRDDLDPRESFGAALAIYLRTLYPTDTEARILADVHTAGFAGETRHEVARILSGTLDAHALEVMLGTYRMAVVVGAAELLLGESIESFLERRAAGDTPGGAGVAMLSEALARSRDRHG